MMSEQQQICATFCVLMNIFPHNDLFEAFHLYDPWISLQIQVQAQLPT
jgi:hypothetical protein